MPNFVKTKAKGKRKVKMSFIVSSCYNKVRNRFVIESVLTEYN